MHQRLAFARMIVPFVFLMITGQALAFHDKEPKTTCAENAITPTPIADLKELKGEWHGLYYWYDIGYKAEELKECPIVDVIEATEQDIEEQKQICQSIAQTDFEFDKLEIIVTVLEQKVLIAKGGDYDKALHFCSYVGRMQFLMVTDDVLLITTPKGGIKNLLARKVLGEEEVKCIVDNIGGLNGFVGYTFC